VKTFNVQHQIMNSFKYYLSRLFNLMFCCSAVVSVSLLFDHNAVVIHVVSSAQ